jgi:protein-L-isoaspartate O-methyltransferase
MFAPTRRTRAGELESKSSKVRSRWAGRRAPYQLILIDGAVEYIPDPFVAQLTDGGRLGTALIDRGICG